MGNEEGKTVPPKISDVTEFKMDQKVYHSIFGECRILNIDTTATSKNVRAISIEYAAAALPIHCSLHGYMYNVLTTNKAIFSSRVEMIKYFQEKKEIKKIEFWMNFYSNGILSHHESKKDADDVAAIAEKTRPARRVKVECFKTEIKV